MGILFNIKYQIVTFEFKSLLITGSMYYKTKGNKLQMEPSFQDSYGSRMSGKWEFVFRL